MVLRAVTDFNGYTFKTTKDKEGAGKELEERFMRREQIKVYRIWCFGHCGPRAYFLDILRNRGEELEQLPEYFDVVLEEVRSKDKEPPTHKVAIPREVFFPEILFGGYELATMREMWVYEVPGENVMYLQPWFNAPWSFTRDYKFTKKAREEIRLMAVEEREKAMQDPFDRRQILKRTKKEILERLEYEAKTNPKLKDKLRCVRERYPKAEEDDQTIE